MTSKKQRPSSEADSRLAGHEITTFHGKRGFNIVFTRACHRSLPWARFINPHYPTLFPLTSIIILPSHLCLSPPSSLFS